jgi:hypothetical protein
MFMKEATLVDPTTLMDLLATPQSIVLSSLVVAPKKGQSYATLTLRFGVAKARWLELIDDATQVGDVAYHGAC